MRKRILSITLALSLILALTPAIALAAPSDVINFPDPNFEAAVREEIGKPTGPITKADAVEVTELLLSSSDISDLTGIEHFTELTDLKLTNNQLTELDVSKNTKLVYLDVVYNQLTELDLSNNLELAGLWLHDNQLTKLDLSNNTKLLYLYCSNNQLTELDVSNSTVLEWLWCNNNLLTELDVSKNTALVSLDCSNNHLTRIDVSNNTALTELNISSNDLTDRADIVGLDEERTVLYFFPQSAADPNLSSAFGPVYATRPISDDDGLTDDSTYYFLTGTIDVPYDRTLLMVNGQFIPHLVEMRDDRALIPLRFVTKAFGASVEWDEHDKTVTMQLEDTTAVVTIGEQFAEVSIDGEVTSHDLYTAAIIIDDHTYVPVRALSEIFDKDVGFEPSGPRRLAYNPFVWIDNKYEWEPDIEAIRADSMSALELLRENFYTMIDGIFADSLVESNEAQLAAIEEIITNMSVTGFIGRYAVIDGPYTMLAEPYSDDIFFNRAVYLMWGIEKVDFNDPGMYLPHYFLG